MTTGERIKHRRKEIGMSAEKLADIIGVSPATMYRYEKGDIEKVPGDILFPLSEALRTTPSYLMGWDTDAARTHTPAGADERLRMFQSLSPDKQRQVLEYMEFLAGKK